MADFIVVLVVAVVVGAAIAHIVKEKKRGARCVGCPDGGCSCSGGAGCNGNCGDMKQVNIVDNCRK